MADAAVNQKMVIGYWTIRGLMQPIRMACALGGLEYEWKQYPCGDKDENGNYDKSEWLNEKHKLGLDIPNLPYLIESDGSSFTESQAILTYVCTKGGLTKDYSAVEHAQAHAFCLEVQDIRNKAAGLFYFKWDGNWEDEGACGKYAANAKKQFERLEKIVAKNGAGAGLIKTKGFCAAEIHLAEMVYQHELMRPQILEECPALKAFTKAFFEIDVIAKMEAECKLAVNNKMAGWGSKYMDGPTF